MKIEEVKRDSLGRKRTKEQEVAFAKIREKALPEGLVTKAFRIVLDKELLELFSKLNSRERGEIVKLGFLNKDVHKVEIPKPEPTKIKAEGSPKLLNQTAFAKAVGTPRSTIRDAIARGDIETMETTHNGKTVNWIPETEVQKYLAKKKS